MADLHNRTRYLKGCRCDACRASQSLYLREYRAAKKAKEQGDPGVVPPSKPATAEPLAQPVWAPGAVTAGVEMELKDSIGAEKRPGLAATALALAAVLDNRRIASQHPAAARQLADILDVLGRQGTKRKSKLADLRSIEGGKSA